MQRYTWQSTTIDNRGARVTVKYPQYMDRDDVVLALRNMHDVKVVGNDVPLAPGLAHLKTAV